MKQFGTKVSNFLENLSNLGQISTPPPKKGLFGPVLAGPRIRDFEDPGIRDCWIEDRNLELVPAWD